MTYFDTPRGRRLVADAEAMKALREQSSILDYQAHGDPPERYLVTFRGIAERSEEHTSELQSQSNLVCRLLPEKKQRVLLPRRRAPLRSRLRQIRRQPPE